MLRELLHSSLSEASRKLYSRAWVVFTEFYQRYQNVQVTLRVSAACVALFISFLCAKGLAPATINSYLSAIAYVHKIQGHYDPTKSFLIAKLLVAVGRRSQADIRLPISRPLLYELVRALACCIISRLSEFCIGHFMPYYMPVGLINGHLVCYYMMYCAGPRASKTMLALHIKLQSLFHLS